MIRKILKWIGIVLGSLVGLLVLAFVVLYVIGTVQWNRIRGMQHDVPVERITIPTDQASITRGEHIAAIRMCGFCHTKTLSGQFDTVPGLITLSFPNLTAGAGGIGGTNTDEDWVSAAVTVRGHRAGRNSDRPRRSAPSHATAGRDTGIWRIPGPHLHCVPWASFQWGHHKNGR